MSNKINDLDYITLPSISPQQQQTIELLLTGQSQTSVAKHLSIAPETISRWKLEADFVAALNGARLARWEAMQAAIDNLSQQAVDALVELLQDEAPKVRLDALKLFFNMYSQHTPDGSVNVEKVRLDLKNRHKVSETDFLFSLF